MGKDLECVERCFITNLSYQNLGSYLYAQQREACSVQIMESFVPIVNIYKKFLMLEI